MDRELYLDELERNNGYCDCSNLREVYEKRRRAELFSGRSEFFRRNVNLRNPSREDAPFLLDYRKAVFSLQAEARHYHSALGTKIGEGSVILTLHEGRDFSLRRQISPKERNELLTAGENPVITCHCVFCRQQIDVLYTD